MDLTRRRPLLNMIVRHCTSILLLQNCNFLSYCTIVQGKIAQTSMKSISQKCRGMAVTWKDRTCKDYTRKPIPIYFLSVFLFPVISCQTYTRIAWKLKPNVGMELTVQSLYVLSCLVTAIPIPIPSFCCFWHCHPYIPLHLLEMFFILVLYVSESR